MCRNRSGMWKRIEKSGSLPIHLSTTTTIHCKALSTSSSLSEMTHTKIFPHIFKHNSGLRFFHSTSCFCVHMAAYTTLSAFLPNTFLPLSSLCRCRCWLPRRRTPSWASTRIQSMREKLTVLLCEDEPGANGDGRHYNEDWQIHWRIIKPLDAAH